jgi:hypothetical protein
MDKIDLKMMGVIIQIITEELKKKNEYRFACKCLSASELSLLSNDFNVLEERKLQDDKSLYIVTKNNRL